MECKECGSYFDHEETCRFNYWYREGFEFLENFEWACNICGASTKRTKLHRMWHNE